MISELIKGDAIHVELQKALSKIHSMGPTDVALFEKLAYFKKFHEKIFSEYESKIITAIGLFYKPITPNSLFEEIYSIFSDSIMNETENTFTPFQASAYKQIKSKKYFSFSAPTSAGKSYLFRELLQTAVGDIVIVVPSRALIAEYYEEVINLLDNNVLVLQFIEDINKERTDRRVYIITPERGPELFKYADRFNIELLLLDEAQISEEPIRGMRFDAFIRRVDRVFPYAKKVFAHPFINNPEAQLLKHDFKEDSSYKNYDLYTVGKIFLSYQSEEFEFFSPHSNDPMVKVGYDIAEKVLQSNGTLLIYISKKKIYEGKYLTDFEKYINFCEKIHDPKALKIIEDLRKFIGASKQGVDKHSLLIDMMERGIVIHHGSMPLKARLFIEKFVKLNFAKICFATSTLSQGINMPFDVVWIDNFHNLDALTLKNLFGRAGRSTKESKFDFGYTIIKKQNIKTFIARFNQLVTIESSSLLDVDINEVSEDERDLVEALRNDSFNDELNLTESQLQRISESGLNKEVLVILDNLLSDNLVPITGKQYYELGTKRRKVKDAFRNIYVEHLRRSKLKPPETAVLSAAIPIMLWHIQGKSFSEIVSLRYAFLSEKDKVNEILNKVKKEKITLREGQKLIQEVKVRFTPIPTPLPNIKLRMNSLFGKIPVEYIDFDTVVYDTYDYLDKVISFSLTDPICAVFEVYAIETGDERARVMKNYIRYGTNDEKEIWLLKYGFSFEEIEWLKDYVSHIDESKISFGSNIEKLNESEIKVIERYID